MCGYGGGGFRASNGNGRKCQTLNPIPIGIDHTSLNLNPKLATVYPTLTHRIHEVPIRKGITATCQLALVLDFGRIDTSGGDSGTRQCTIVGDSFNDEQRGDHLSNPSSYWASHPRIRVTGKHEPVSRQGWVRTDP